MIRPAKEVHKQKILDYMADTDNPWPTRKDMPIICGITPQTFYHHFPPGDITEIEAEGLILRRSRCAKISAVVDQALIDKCSTGDPAAIKLYYQRIEAWSEKNTTELKNAEGETLKTEASLSPELEELIKQVAGKC